MCGPHNFQGKPKLNKKEKVRFREEPLGWADWMFLGSAPLKEDNQYVPRGKLRRLVVTCGDTREQT
tara:strand:+ start:561 stop:758 length:198 start_codon:yes stop_codon:yes gene_type:complete